MVRVGKGRGEMVWCHIMIIRVMNCREVRVRVDGEAGKEKWCGTRS